MDVCTYIGQIALLYDDGRTCEGVGLFSSGIARRDSVEVFGYVYKWLPSDVGTRKFISLLNIDETYCCTYALRWVAIPASSKNQTLAYAYIQELLNEKAVNGGISDNLIDTYRETPPEFQDPNFKFYNVVIPSTWQYALSDLFDNYYAGHMETDEFMNRVQKRLEVYITE